VNALWGNTRGVLFGDLLFTESLNRLIKEGNTTVLHLLTLSTKALVMGEILEYENEGKTIGAISRGRLPNAAYAARPLPPAQSPKIRSQGPEKEEVDVAGIFEGVDTSSLADVKKAIEAHDSAKFATAYRTMLESCYSCHKSVGRPYLRPMIPAEHVQSALTMDPNAKWPQ
jgi:hypothetical protein